MPLLPADAFPFCGPTYLAASPVIDCQRSINLYPDPGISSSKSRMGLTGRPGYALFSSALSGAGHSLWAGNGRLFAASGQKVFEVSNTGTIITDYGIGLTGTQRRMPIIANGTQLLICDPAAGSIFNINPVGPSLDLVFNGVALEYLDGFYIAIATGASLGGTNPNQINASKNGDGTNWPGLSVVIETSAADLIIQLATLNSLLYVFGQKTLRVWYNAGASPFPLARVNGGTINLGCLAPQSVVKFSNTILWLGSDQTGYGQVYMMQGMNPVRVSNSAIEGIITTYANSLTNSNVMTATRAFGYQEAGHTFYLLQLVAATGLTAQTLVYDLTTGLWHERAYAGTLQPADFASVPNFGASGSNFVISETNGRIYFQGIQYPGDAGTAITYTRTAPHVGSENRWFKYPRFELDGDFGTAQPILTYSNDGGRTFKPGAYALQQAAAQGNPSDVPEMPRFYATQLGRSRDRVFKVSITDSTNLIRIANAYLTAEPAA